MNLEQMQIQLETLQAKQDLHELVANYCTGVDRRDRSLLESLWWPEATMDFGLFVGPAAQFCELICADNPAVEITWHFTSNETFEIDGDRASGRAYVIGMSALAGDDKPTQHIAAGRYLDQYERRGGVWKFSKRLFVLDLNFNESSSAIWDKGIGAAVTRGRSDRDDVSYSFA
ncbi:nuclear transport factor 2 family protein [Pseudomonas sp. MAP12]|uniref:Nuclear transport factor 2 family protein n=1 Tax=Geopseudomonas aromaticivorans TaxID=2849492 RepID=A0ABS6MW35_9GAMM|nr:nuclear transport factor 2 family protein [Pseudomonas aromaticivorans]MBV2132497.1 nuclear transport factor 2 family protein [Pseudomonas aromaticivorans]